MSRKETAAQQPVGRRRTEGRRRRAPRDAEASGGGRPGVPGEARAGARPSGLPPLGAERQGRARTLGFPGSVGEGCAQIRPPPWIPSLRSSGRKTPVESAAENFSRPAPPVIAEWEFRACTIVLVLRSKETGARPGWVRGSLRAAMGSLGLRPHVQGAWPGIPAAHVSSGSLSASRGRSALPRRLSPCPCHLGPLPAGPLCLLIPGRRKPAGGISVSGPFSASGGFGHLRGRYGDPVCFPRRQGWGCVVVRWDLARSGKFCLAKKACKVCSWFAPAGRLVDTLTFGCGENCLYTGELWSGPLRLSPETGELCVRQAGLRLSTPSHGDPCARCRAA